MQYDLDLAWCGYINVCTQLKNKINIFFHGTFFYSVFLPYLSFMLCVNVCPAHCGGKRDVLDQELF